MKMQAAIKDLKKLRREFGKIDKEAAKVEKYTILDIKKRAPGMVSTATSKIYKIKKSEVARARTKNKTKNAGKQHVRSAFKGQSLDDFTMVFRGKKTATWDTKAKPKPKPPKTGNKKVFSTRKKYKVTVEVFRGKPTPIKPQGKNRVYVAMIGGKLRPLVVSKDNLPMMKASTSVPQAIMNEQTVAIWRPELNAYVLKRFTHHSKRYWAGNI
jgi:hypothetical protein